MDGSLAEPVCPWYYPIPCLVSRPRVASLGIRDRPNGGIARKNYVPELFLSSPRSPHLCIREFCVFARKEKKRERKKEAIFPSTESKVSRSSEKVSEMKTRDVKSREGCKIISFVRNDRIAVRNKNTYARFSMPLKTARLIHVGVYSFVFRTKIVLHLFKKTLFQDR